MTQIDTITHYFFKDNLSTDKKILLDLFTKHYKELRKINRSLADRVERSVIDYLEYSYKPNTIKLNSSIDHFAYCNDTKTWRVHLKDTLKSVKRYCYIGVPRKD